MIKTFHYEFPVLVFWFQKFPTKFSSLCLLKKIMKPSVHASEIRQRLLLDGVVDADDLPSASQINKRIRRDLVMSKKKLSVIPSESNKLPDKTNILTPYLHFNHTKSTSLTRQV